MRGKRRRVANANFGCLRFGPKLCGARVLLLLQPFLGECALLAWRATADPVAATQLPPKPLQWTIASLRPRCLAKWRIQRRVAQRICVYRLWCSSF